MNSLAQLAEVIHKRNLVEQEITAIIGRPAVIGHIGEFIASKVFNIALGHSASQKSIDGHFCDGPLNGCTVNVKWYSVMDGLLAITPEALPDYYLVLTGPKTPAMSSRGRVRPWTIQYVFLFQAQALVDGLSQRGIKFSVATSVRQEFWDRAEIYPGSRNDVLSLSEVQRAALLLFSHR